MIAALAAAAAALAAVLAAKAAVIVVDFAALSPAVFSSQAQSLERPHVLAIAYAFAP